MFHPSGFPHAAASCARVLVAAFACVAPFAAAQDIIPDPGPDPVTLSPGAATLESPSLGASVTERFTVDFPAGFEALFLCLDSCERDGPSLGNSGTLADGQSTWTLDYGSCGSDADSCQVVVGYAAGDAEPRRAELLAIDGFGRTASATLSGTLAAQPEPEPGEATLSVSTGSVTEGGAPLRIRIERVGGADGRLTAFFGAEDIDATEGADYTLSPSGPLVWEDGDTDARTVTVTALADAVVEGTETFEFLLARRGDDLDQSAEITILDATPDPEPGVVRFAEAAYSVPEDGGEVVLTATRSGGSDGAAVVAYRFTDGTAVADRDYDPGSAATRRIRWADGESGSRTIRVPIVDGPGVEPDETFTVTLALPATEGEGPRVALGEPRAATVTIADDDVAGALAFDPLRYAVTEATGTVTLSVARTGGAAGAASVRWQAGGGDAEAGADYAPAGAATNGTLRWAAGDARPRTITLAVASDTLIEGEESFDVTLSAPSGATLGEGTVATVLIGDSTPVPLDRLAFDRAERDVDEGSGGARLIVSRTGDGRGAATVRYRIEPATASRDDLSADAVLAGTLSWVAGDTGNRTVDVPIADDARVEDDERVVVTLSDANGAVIGSPASSVVVIVDDERPGTVAFEPTRYTASEGDGRVTLTVVRTGGRAGAASVRWATRDGSARAGVDYGTGDGATSGTLSWPAGDGEPRRIVVDIAGDDAREPDEDFAVTLSGASGAAVGDARTATVTIEDASVVALDRLAFTAPSIEVGEGGGNALLSVRRTGGGAGAATVRYAIELGDDGAPAGTATRADIGRGVALEGTLSWAAGDTGERTVGLRIVADGLVEPDERFTVRLREPRGAALGSPDALAVTIVDDDVAPVPEAGTLRFAVAAPRVEESAGEALVGVERVGGTDGAVSVDVATLDGEAVAGLDYAPVESMLRWEDGEGGLRFVTVPLLSDTEVEEEERFLVRLANATADGEPLALEDDEIAVTIVDTTRLGTLVLSDARVEALESAGEVVIAVSRTGGSDGPMQVSYESLLDPEGLASTRARDLVPASAPDDFARAAGTLSWADGEDGVREARVAIVDDAVDEPDETFRVRFFGTLPVGTEISGDGEVVVTIVDDDAPFVTGDPNVEPLAALGSLRLVVASGDGQSGLPGDILEPMIAGVVDEGSGNRAVPNVPVRWIVSPAGSAELLEGARTVSGGDGQVRNRVRVRTRGFLSVVAVIDVAGAAADAGRDGTAPGEALFLVRAGLAAQLELSATERAVGGALDALCEGLGARIEGGEELPPASLDLNETCGVLDARVADGDARLGASLGRLAPEELFAIGDSVIDTADIQVTNVYARINAIRAARRGRVDLSGFDLDVYGERIPGSVVDAAGRALRGAPSYTRGGTRDEGVGNRGTGEGPGDDGRTAGNGRGTFGHGGGGASGDDGGLGSRLGVFVNGSVSVGEVDGAGEQRDADIATAGVTVGVDYRFTPDTVAGVGLGLVVNETAFGSGDGGVDLDGLALTLFSTYYEPDAGYVDGVLELGRNAYDVRRRINLPGLPDQFGLGETDADVLSATIGAGKDFRAGRYELGPYFRLSHTRASVAGYAERAEFDGDGAGSVLDIDAHEVRSTRLAVGGQLSRTIDTRRGVLVPQLRLETELENEERKGGITARFRHDPDGVPFTVNGDPRDTDGYVNLGLGASAVFANGRSGYLFYETRAGHEYVTQHWLKAGFRLEF